MTLDPTTIDPSRYRYIPGTTEVGDIDLDQTIVHDAVTGKRVTEDDIEQEAQQLEQRYPGLRPGGKSLSGDGSHSPVLRVVVSPDTRDKIEHAAKADGMSVSRWLRRTVEEKLAA